MVFFLGKASQAKQVFVVLDTLAPGTHSGTYLRSMCAKFLLSIASKQREEIKVKEGGADQRDWIYSGRKGHKNQFWVYV